jgi:hypothetical protein
MLPNQTNSISQQLNDGVRALMIDVYDVSGVPTVYHGFSYLGTKPLAFELDQIKTFLDNNINEIVTIIFETNITAVALETAIDSSGLEDYLFAKDSVLPWPTLQEMIDAGKRLVVFSEEDNAAPGQDWYHYIWDHAVETEFSVHDTSEFTSDYNRGDSINELFILNHFITNSVTGTGSSAEAQKANSNPFLMNRVNGVIQAKNKFPNFLTLDFYEIGNGSDAVDYLNNLNWFNVDEKQKAYHQIRVWPVPSAGIINFEIPENIVSAGGTIRLINLMGHEIYCAEIFNLKNIIDISDNKFEGLCFLLLTGSNGNILLTKEIIFTK